MEVQAHYMMIRDVMKSHLIKLLTLAISLFGLINTHAQCYSVPRLPDNKKVGDPYTLESTGNFSEAFRIYKSYVDINSSTSDKEKYWYFFAVGHFLAHGHGVDADIDSAIYYLEKAATLERKNNSYSYNAHHLLSKLYYFPKYGIVDLKKSFQYLTEAASLGDIKSCLELGEIYLKGYANRLQDTTMIKIESHTGKNGIIYKSRRFSFGVKSTSDILRYPFVEIDSVKGYSFYVDGIEVNKRLIDKPYILSNIDIAVAAIDGTYLPVDYDLAWDCLSSYLEDSFNDNEVSFDDEYAEAFWRIQMLYRFGLGTRVDMRKADMYLKKAAQCGHSKAIQVLKQ